ncbi:hypothetical protein B0H11DRAFT_2128147, partial [Mycena galericulata]
MKFSTASLLLAFVAGAMAQDVGEPCPADQAGDVGCANTPRVAGGNSYIFICNGIEFVLDAVCGSPTDCVVTGPQTAFC